MCHFWREDSVELPARVWNRFLDELKAMSGAFYFGVSGGEPLLKADCWEMFEHCGRKNIVFGLVTNGLLLTDDNIKRLLDCGIYHINVSIDSLDDAVHDGMRGIPGLLRRTRANLERLVDITRQQKIKLPIIVKTVVCAENLPNQGLERLVGYARDLGIAGVSFQPLAYLEWGDTDENIEQMWKVDPALLRETVERLIRMKREGQPIVNPEPVIAEWPDYFAKAPAPERTSPCTVPLRNLRVYPDGKIEVCGPLQVTIGNIATDSIRDLWVSKPVKAKRAKLVKCRKTCMGTCVVKRRSRDYLELFRRLSR
jgi:MoaA/NifB/PqqE/SkfB family radical SAM enzyme